MFGVEVKTEARRRLLTFHTGRARWSSTRLPLHTRGNNEGSYDQDAKKRKVRTDAYPHIATRAQDSFVHSPSSRTYGPCCAVAAADRQGISDHLTNLQQQLRRRRHRVAPLQAKCGTLARRRGRDERAVVHSSRPRCCAGAVRLQSHQRITTRKQASARCSPATASTIRTLRCAMRPVECLRSLVLRGRPASHEPLLLHCSSLGTAQSHTSTRD